MIPRRQSAYQKQHQNDDQDRSEHTSSPVPGQHIAIWRYLIERSATLLQCHSHDLQSGQNRTLHFRRFSREDFCAYSARVSQSEQTGTGEGR